MTQPVEEEHEGTITPFGIVLKDPTKSSATALGIFATQMTSHYQNREEEGYDLWINFLEDFGDWDEASFKKVEKGLLRNLRDLLFDRDVYTPEDGTPIYKHLARLAVQPWRWLEWPADVPKPKEKSYVDSANISNTPSTPALGNNSKTATLSKTAASSKTAAPSKAAVASNDTATSSTAAALSKTAASSKTAAPSKAAVASNDAATSSTAAALSKTAASSKTAAPSKAAVASKAAAQQLSSSAALQLPAKLQFPATLQFSSFPATLQTHTAAQHRLGASYT